MKVGGKKAGGPISAGSSWRDEDAQKVLIELGSKQWRAWDEYTRALSNPVGLPFTTFANGQVGWRCMGEWPPGDYRNRNADQD
jgi:hypothetical protein